MVSRHWLYFAGFVISAVALVGVGLLGLADAVSVLTAGGVYYGEEFILLAMLGEAAEWVMLGLVVGAVAALFLIATVVSILRNASVPRSDRLVQVVEWLEHRYPVLRTFDVSEKVEPTVEDRKQELKEQYVAGELSDDEFEREMERLMHDDESDSAQTETVEYRR